MRLMRIKAKDYEKAEVVKRSQMGSLTNCQWFWKVYIIVSTPSLSSMIPSLSGSESDSDVARIETQPQAA
jgi:hypothetical protein